MAIRARLAFQLSNERARRKSLRTVANRLPTVVITAAITPNAKRSFAGKFNSCFRKSIDLAAVSGGAIIKIKNTSPKLASLWLLCGSLPHYLWSPEEVEERFRKRLPIVS